MQSWNRDTEAENRLVNTAEKGEGGREPQEEGDICILMADSCCCTAETNTTL